GLLLTSEPGVCLGFGEVVRKIANFYGIKIGVDIAVRFGEISDALIQDEPSLVLAASERATADSLENGLGSDRVRLMIEGLISGESRLSSKDEWYRRTEEILFLCGSPLFSKDKAPSFN
ncbi:MAG: hypothetical protein JXB23_04990, partial [Candidatus Aminicenantes bacterium]|nr:hypothetical protein [Candidatus Aminicenantes bacterium]